VCWASSCSAAGQRGVLRQGLLVGEPFRCWLSQGLLCQGLRGQVVPMRIERFGMWLLAGAPGHRCRRLRRGAIRSAPPAVAHSPLSPWGRRAGVDRASTGRAALGCGAEGRSVHTTLSFCTRPPFAARSVKTESARTGRIERSFRRLFRRGQVVDHFGGASGIRERQLGVLVVFHTDHLGGIVGSRGSELRANGTLRDGSRVEIREP
jgi:hypothetical protein